MKTARVAGKLWMIVAAGATAALMAGCQSQGSTSGPGACAQGSEGCGCFADFTCSAGAAPLVCAGSTCVKASCPPGTAGCPCASGSICQAGSCSGGLCVASDMAAPPASPVCYTPCTSGIVRGDGSYLSCSAEGLMQGCLDGKTCAGGSCVATGSSAPACAADVDCPDFQACIQGHCYSNCRFDSDCSSGRQCFKHVCRTTCAASADTCPTGTSCATSDGDSGYCVPMRAAEGVPQTEVLGTFRLSASSVDFSSSRLTGAFTIHNDGPVGAEFKVRKLEHTEFGGVAPVIVGANPLGWLRLSSDASPPVAAPEITVFVDAGGSQEVRLGGAATPTLARWEGRVEVSSQAMGRRVVSLSYVSRPEGRWTGKVHYFGAFSDRELAPWADDRGNATLLGRVGNAFVQRWGAFMRGAIPWDEFQAVVTATVSESWKWQSVRDICADAQACYLYDKGPGYGAYTTSLESNPIPTGVSVLPVGMNLKVDPTDPRRLTGKIVTSEALQYAGDPALTITFAADPASCASGVSGACVARLADLDAQIRIGGRYLTDAGDAGCSRASGGGFVKASVPWLVSGFEEGTSLDATSGLRYRHECRDTLLPFGSGGAATGALNLSFAQSNPIPDGRSRVRRLELVDGALLDQETLFIIFRERFEESFLGEGDTQGFSAYGFMTLRRSPAELDAAAYQAQPVIDGRPQPATPLGAGCSADVVERVLGPGGTITAVTASDLARGVVEGIRPGQAATRVDPGNPLHPKVHYLCHDLGLLDGGPLDDGSATGIKVKCPPGSGVTFFLAQLAQVDVARQTCQRDGSCQDTLLAWRDNAQFAVELDPLWRCDTLNAVFCDGNRQDLRAGKAFYLRNPQQPAYLPLATAIDQAFRYKTQFRNRQGTTLGFTPEQCVRDGEVITNAIPYCYDPPGIEEARRRVDCAVHLHDAWAGRLDAPAQATLIGFLTGSFGYTQDLTGAVPQVRDGFERLNAELLIMLGDEAYTKAFASRFDLAGSRMLTFQGALFEPSGINLAGAAGAEMYQLYLAGQYYQSALDRFYRISPEVWHAITAPDATRNFISKETVVSWFDRLARASTQKARAWSEVAKRYQAFNRPDLARHVSERAYTAAYVESIVLSRMMLQVVSVVDPADRDFIVQRAELASLGYRASLLDMRDVYAGISDDPTIFGYAPDFVPFPALDPGDVNAFTKMLAAARQSVASAAGKEEQALASTRAFDTDAAQFEAELVRLRTGYEGQLAGLCGTFTGTDGLIHPATQTYAYLDPVARFLGDPCGFAGNGQIHDALGQVELAALEVESVRRRFDDLEAQVGIEVDRVNAQCGLSLTAANYRWQQRNKVNDLQGVLRGARLTLSGLERVKRNAEVVSNLAKCSVGVSTDCPTATAALFAFQVISAQLDLVSLGVEAGMAVAEGEIAEIEAASTLWEGQHQCEVLRADSDATMRRLALEVAHLDLEGLKVQYRLKLALSDAQQLRNQATRLFAEQQEMEQQTINVAAARNDPNIRIYKNDAVILADQTFQQALRDVYKATKVFEYFTSQSYGRLDQLFLVRMVSHGDYNLESYLIELENAYRDFQQQYGNPDTRVDVVSLRDDVLSIPRTGADGKPLTQSERIAEFRRRLADATLLDDRGYLTVPFSTTLDRVSPLTRNHKVLALEAELVGADLGDTVGRIYLRQRGTGAVRSVADEQNFYRLPERTAVLNPFFNGVRVFGPEVYRSDRMRNRPFANTHWELVINQKDERANQDVNLQSLTDVRLYVYYTDFTQL